MSIEAMVIVGGIVFGGLIALQVYRWTMEGLLALTAYNISAGIVFIIVAVKGGGFWFYLFSGFCFIWAALTYIIYKHPQPKKEGE